MLATTSNDDCHNGPMSPPTSTGELLDAVAVEIGRRLNPTQADTSSFINWAFREHPVITVIVGALGGEASIKVLKEHQQFTDDLRILADAAGSISRHGWALSKYTPLAGCRKALEMVEAGVSDDQIDEVLTAAWNQSGLFDTLASRVGVLGAADPELHAIGLERQRLVQKAIVHHRKGAFEASIPILLAQIEGICRDATTTDDCPDGRSFFTKRPDSREAVIDDATVAGMECGLNAVRAWFSHAVPTSGPHRLGSRHGVLHGRDVAYDTILMSTKCLALLIAIWEWANRKLGLIAAERTRARYAHHAGIDGTDEQGWRLDRRGFTDTRLALSTLDLVQLGYFTRNGCYGTIPQLLVDAASRAMLAGAPTAPACKASSTGSAWNASLRSESGWVFSIGGSDGTTYYADGPTAPPNPPRGTEWRTDRAGNWSGDCCW